MCENCPQVYMSQVVFISNRAHTSAGGFRYKPSLLMQSLIAWFSHCFAWFSLCLHGSVFACMFQSLLARQHPMPRVQHVSDLI